jgi:putative ABC transport system permease protein
VNLASAMLARGTARSSEFAVRTALGATRTRLVRQLFTESALLAALGCAAGLALAAVLLKALAWFTPPALHVERVHVDAWVQGFALVVAAMTALLFGLLPALRLSDGNSAQAMREASRGTAGAKKMRAWNVLVGTEVALAVVLLSGSALLIRSFAKVMETRMGFEPANVYTVGLELPDENYPDSTPAMTAFHQHLLDRLSHINGVQAAGLTNILPLSGNYPSGGMIVEGKPLDPRGPFTGYSVYRVVGGDFFAAMGIPLIEGRAFRDSDDNAAAPSVIVNEEFAKQEWPGQDPLGKRVKVSGMDRVNPNAPEPWYTVVGVAGNVRGQTVTGPYRETYYFPYRTRPAYRTRWANYVVRSALPAGAIAPLIRREIAAIDHEVPVEIKTMNDVVTQSVADRRFTMLVLGAFAAIALLLAVVGIYAVVSYAVAQRTREIGVRIALGATSGEVRRLVLRSAMRAVVPGLAVGALLAAGTAQALRTLLYGVTPFDAAALAGAIGLLGFAAVVSSSLPAMRATRVDPLIAMQAE